MFFSGIDLLPPRTGINATFITIPFSMLPVFQLLSLNSLYREDFLPLV